MGSGISFTYNVPSRCLFQSCGLIVDVHGYTMNAASEDRNSNMQSLGEMHGYIVVQPGAATDLLQPAFAAPNWNADAHGNACTGINKVNGTIGKQTCWTAPWKEEPIGDRAIHNWVQEALQVKAWNIDRHRVHFFGFSEGGWMAARMLCNYPKLFASIAMLSGASNADPFDCVKPNSTQVPLLVNQGLNDYSSLWREFDAGFKKLKTKWQLSSSRLIAGNSSCKQEWQFECHSFGCTCQGFADWYGVTHLSFGCAATATAQKWYEAQRCHSVAAHGAHHGGCHGCFSHKRYQSSSGAPIEVIAYDYVADYFDKGHCFPGSDNTRLQIGQVAAYGCPGAKERAAGSKAGYNIGEEAMKFFMANRRKTSQEILV